MNPLLRAHIAQAAISAVISAVILATAAVALAEGPRAQAATGHITPSASMALTAAG